jgi:sigma-E factor negative regulatory protein RseA
MVAGSDTPQVMLRNPRLDEFLAAHGHATAGSVLQSPPGFVRNASFEGANR